MTGPLVHIGYHKTGTSWLQRCLFTRADIGFGSLEKHAEIHEQLVYPNPLVFDASSCRARLEARLQLLVGRGLQPVVSSERLSGNPHSGGYDAKELAERIAKVFPLAKVLIVIREQRAAVLSTYKQYVRAGGPCTLDDYLYPPERGKSRIPFFDFEHFSYHHLIRTHQTLLGPERLLVLPYELFLRQPLAFVQRVCHFVELAPPDGLLATLPMQLRVNASRSGAAIAVKRILNRLLVRDRLNPGALFPLRRPEPVLRTAARVTETLAPRYLNRHLEARLESHVAKAIGRRYRESNAETARRTGIDLAGWGYDV